MIIKEPNAEDFSAWAELMRGYFKFYHFPINDNHLEQVFNKIIKDKTIFSFIAFINGKAVGLTNYMFNQSTFSLTECYLSDLYVLPAARGNNIATQLINQVKSAAKIKQCREIYWLTASDNTTAQSVYNKIADKTSWFIYSSETN